MIRMVLLGVALTLGVALVAGDAPAADKDGKPGEPPYVGQLYPIVRGRVTEVGQWRGSL